MTLERYNELKAIGFLKLKGAERTEYKALKAEFEPDKKKKPIEPYIPLTATPEVAETPVETSTETPLEYDTVYVPEPVLYQDPEPVVFKTNKMKLAELSPDIVDVDDKSACNILSDTYDIESLEEDELFDRAFKVMKSGDARNILRKYFGKL